MIPMVNKAAAKVTTGVSIIEMLVDEMVTAIQFNINKTLGKMITDEHGNSCKPFNVMVSKHYTVAKMEAVWLPTWVVGYHFPEHKTSDIKLIAMFHPMFVIVHESFGPAIRGDIYKPDTTKTYGVIPDFNQRMGSVFGQGPVIEEEDLRMQ